MYVLRINNDYIDDNFQITSDIEKAKVFHCTTYIDCILDALDNIPSEWLNELGLKLENELKGERKRKRESILSSNQ